MAKGFFSGLWPAAGWKEEIHVRRKGKFTFVGKRISGRLAML
jgi:hypothetical protein